MLIAEIVNKRYQDLLKTSRRNSKIKYRTGWAGKKVGVGHHFCAHEKGWVKITVQYIGGGL